MATKRGRMSKYEYQFIRDNVHHMDYLAIAKQLEREPDTIRRYIEDKLGMTISLDVSQAPVSFVVQYDIEDEEFWPVLQHQFSPEELDIFKYQWDQIYAQFGGDVLPTEKLQIVDTIKLEILMNRNLREQRESAKSIERCEQELMMEKSKDDDVDPPIGQDKSTIFELEKQLSFYRSAQTALGKDYRELQTNKNKMFENIKGTRQQRIQRIESSSETFLKWMADLVNNPEKRKDLGRRMEKMRLAVLDEEIRLGAYHKYEDGNIDQPYLTPENVKEDNGRTNLIKEQHGEPSTTDMSKV